MKRLEEIVGAVIGETTEVPDVPADPTLRRVSLAREFQRQSIAEVVVSGGESVGRRLAQRIPPDKAGVVAGRMVQNDELNHAVHYFTATVAHTIRSRRKLS
jgi:hypothetical protein